MLVFPPLEHSMPSHVGSSVSKISNPLHADVARSTSRGRVAIIIADYLKTHTDQRSPTLFSVSKPLLRVVAPPCMEAFRVRSQGLFALKTAYVLV